MPWFWSKIIVLLGLSSLAVLFSCRQPVARPTFTKTAAASSDSKKKPTGQSSSDDENPLGSEDQGGYDLPQTETPKPTPETPDDPKEDPKPNDPQPKELTPLQKNVWALDNFRWEMPCEKMDGNELCFSDVKVNATKTIGGKSNEIHEVELKFRGVVEPMKYKDGRREGERFYIGGTPNDPTYNIYSIEVSNPKQIYYLNWAETTGHDIFSINYTAKIKMNGGATVRLIGEGQNDKMIANFKNVVAPDITKLPDGNKGQFIQMNVVGVVLAPNPTPTPTLPKRDITFYVVSDTHADAPSDSYDLRAMAKAINNVGRGGKWPSQIAGNVTNFVGGNIAEPRGVVFTGDLAGWGVAPAEIQTFRRYFEKGVSGDSIRYPGYIGLGNHDVDSTADRSEDQSNTYRKQFWSYVDSRHKGSGAPVKVKAFDAASHSYSWDWDDVHFVQGHRFVGDNDHGLPSNVDFVKKDLQDNARDRRPVFFFQHYGMDSFGTQERWWSDNERANYLNIIKNYNVNGIFAGHTHYAQNYDWEGKRIFQVNNAKNEDANSGNKDGKGSFTIVRLTDKRIDVVTCRWLDDQGRYELIEPFYSADLLK